MQIHDWHNRPREIISSHWAVVSRAGQEAGCLWKPTAVAVLPNGNIVVADLVEKELGHVWRSGGGFGGVIQPEVETSARLQVFTITGELVTSFSLVGSKEALLWGLCVTPDARLFATDPLHNRVFVFGASAFAQ